MICTEAYTTEGPFKNPKDGESRRKTAKNAERRRNKANYVVIMKI